jgi:hypothetical protein
MIKVAENISKKAKAQRTTAILSKVQQVNEKVIISSERYNSPLTPSPNIQAILESFNVNAKTLKKTRGPNRIILQYPRGYRTSKWVTCYNRLSKHHINGTIITFDGTNITYDSTFITLFSTFIHFTYDSTFITIMVLGTNITYDGTLYHI